MFVEYPTSVWYSKSNRTSDIIFTSNRPGEIPQKIALVKFQFAVGDWYPDASQIRIWVRIRVNNINAHIYVNVVFLRTHGIHVYSDPSVI